MLTGAVRRASRRSLVDWCAVSGQAPGSGAERRGQVLDEVSTAIHGGAAAVNASHHREIKLQSEAAQLYFIRVYAFVRT